MFKKYILQGQEKVKNSKIITREIAFGYDILKLNKIVSFIWPRRAGKTFFMLQIVQKLIKQKKLKLEQIVFLDFSEFVDKKIDFNKIVESFYELYPKLTPFFIFDEIQEVTNFTPWLLWLFNKWYKIFVSGSNSHLLSSEIATQLRGRFYQQFILPLSFCEFLDFKKFSKKAVYGFKETWVLKSFFQEYLLYGWYPEPTLISEKTIKLWLIKDYFEVLIYKDIKERYAIREEYVLKYLIKRLLDATTKEININKIYQDIKSQNIAVSKDTLYNYTEYLQNVFLFKKVTNFYTKVRWFNKLYLYDTAFFNMLGSEGNQWKRLETIILWELIRRWETIYFKKNEKEIDFYSETTDTDYQICYELNNEDITRELTPLEKSTAKHKILIYVNEKNIETKTISKKIKIIRFWDFLFNKK